MDSSNPASFKLGEGLIGQCASEKKALSISNIPDGYLKITSGTSIVSPGHLELIPIVHLNKTYGVIELGFINEISELQKQYLKEAAPAIAIHCETAANRDTIDLALENSQQLSNELQDRQLELQVANDNLEKQTKQLKLSEEELKISNNDLAARKSELEKQQKIIKSAKEELEVKAAQLAKSSKYKSEFLANMSHELRTPLNSLLLLSQNLKANTNGNLDENELNDISIIHASGSNLLTLINDIMDLSKVEAGMLRVVNEQVFTQTLIKQLRNTIQPLVLSKDLEFSIKLEENVPAVIMSDHQRIIQILTNLLSNAVKFTSHGSISLNISICENQLLFAVSDTGVGLPPDKLETIFEAFRQADGSISRNYGGTGLGLSISRELARLLNGRIEVESQEGRGSTFTLILNDVQSINKEPKINSENTEPTYSSEPINVVLENKLDGHKILLADDNMRDLYSISKVLIDLGLKVTMVKNGQEALDTLEKDGEFEFALIDINMPDIDGFETIKKARRLEAYKQTPFFTLSAFERPETKEKSLECGADGCISKPVDINLFIETLKESIT